MAFTRYQPGDRAARAAVGHRKYDFLVERRGTVVRYPVERIVLTLVVIDVSHARSHVGFQYHILRTAFRYLSSAVADNHRRRHPGCPRHDPNGHVHANHYNDDDDGGGDGNSKRKPSRGYFSTTCPWPGIPAAIVAVAP